MFDQIKSFVNSLSPSAPTNIPVKQWDISPSNFSLNGPIPVDPSQDEKWICRCGQSKNYPYCDGAHKNYNKENDTHFSPLKVEKGSDVVYVCRCGYSKTTPFCDGSHNTLKLVEDQKNHSVGEAINFLIPIAFFIATGYLIKNHLN